MQLNHVSVVESPINEGSVRLVGDVSYDARSLKPEAYWFEVSEEHAQFLSQSGNPWLALLIPLAVTLGEPLRIGRAVDAQLFEHVQELMRIWKSWYPHLPIVPIEAEVAEPEKRESPSRKAVLFSLGIDAYYTILEHDAAAAAPAAQRPIDDLIYIWGFDVRLDQPEAFRRRREVAQRVASELDKELVVVATNFRHTEHVRAPGRFLSGGCILASSVLALERRYSEVLLSSSHTREQNVPWGTHPLTDPLLSTSQTRIVHYGIEANRLQKTEAVAQSEVAMRALYVCWHPTPSGENCGACEKCLRTMISLELIGMLDRCATFPAEGLTPKRLKRMHTRRTRRVSFYMFFEDTRDLAVKRDRWDLVEALDRVLKRAQRADRWLSPLERLETFGNSLRSKPILWTWVGHPIIEGARVATEMLEGLIP